MEYFAVIAFLLALSAPTNADGSLGGRVYAPGHASVDYYAYPRYAFEYAVRDPHTGDNKAQWEKRDGDVVIGAYSLVEPDGSLRVVEYRADDKTGFNAVVKRIGPNIHPVATPIYKASIPSLGYKSYLPHPIGPVAGLEKLASAPLYNGAYSGSATAGLLYKSIAPAIIKEAAPIPLIGKINEASVSTPAPLYNTEIITKPIYREPTLPIYKIPIPQVPLSGLPILPPPILKQAPLLREPIYSSYLGRSGLGLPVIKNLELDKVPIPQVPNYKAPLLQESYGLPILPPQILKQAPLLREPIYSSYLGRSGLGLPAVKNLGLDKVPIPQVSIYKAPILQESYGLPILPPPISKQAPLLRDPIYFSILGRSGLDLPAVKNPEPIALRGTDYNLLGKRLLDYRRLIDNRAALGYRGNLEYNAPLVYKGYAGP